MAAFGLAPLVAVWLLSVAVLGVGGVVWYFASRKESRPRVYAVIAAPIGCLAIPIIGLCLLFAVGALFKRSDIQLYEEVFGYRPTITEDRMLFDHFGSGRDREIFMRAEPTDAERKRLMAIPGLAESDFTLERFVSRGSEHGFSWWIATEPVDWGYCRSARIRDAHGFRGWLEFHIAECLEAGKEFPASQNIRNIYVIASRRAK